MPWQGGGKEGRVRLHCQEPGVVELLVHLESRQTNSRLLPTFWVWLALHFRRQGTCYLANRSLSTMGPELDMLSQTSLTSVTCVTRSSGTWAVWCNIRFGKKHWKQVIHATNFSGLCPQCCEPKIGPSLKEESSRPLKLPTMLLVLFKLSSWDCPLQIEYTYLLLPQSDDDFCHKLVMSFGMWHYIGSINLYCSTPCCYHGLDFWECRDPECRNGMQKPFTPNLPKNSVHMWEVPNCKGWSFFILVHFFKEVSKIKMNVVRFIPLSVFSEF